MKYLQKKIPSNNELINQYIPVQFNGNIISMVIIIIIKIIIIIIIIIINK